MGKGEMITELARLNPTTTFLGIEKYATVAAKALKRAKELNLENFNIICEDIKKLPELIVGKVDILWLTFSDPWPKNRHAKRRLTHSHFLKLYKQILSKDGVLKFKTDNDKLFEFSVEEMNEFGMEIVHITKDLHNTLRTKVNVMTGYEKKWSDSGKNINYVEAKFR